MKKTRILLSTLLVLVFMFALGVAGASAADVTWNPNDKGDGVVLSNGNLTTYFPSHYGVRTTEGRATGKWYFEVKQTAGFAPVAGVGNSNATLLYAPGKDTNGRSYAGYDGGKVTNGFSYNYGSTWGINAVIGVALNMDAGTITFYKNGVSQGVAFTGLTGLLFPMVGCSSSNTCTLTTNFGATPFAYPIPEGYQPYNNGPTVQAPTNLTVTPGNAQVNLLWTEVTNATSYNIKRSTSSGTEATVASSVYANYSDNTVTNGTTYYYVVTAVSSDGESTNSNEVSATPQAGLPNAPAITATAGDAQVSLEWSEVTGATSYKVKSATTAGGPYTEVADLAGTTCTDTGLTNGTTYYYVVTAVTSSGESGNSNEASATPQQGTTPPAGNGTLVVTVANNADREYNLTMAQIEAFINWYNNRSTGGNVYTIEKPASGAYTRIKDYLIFDKIVAWEVREY